MVPPRGLEDLGVELSQYVPFFFCPRSIMLFVIHCANHPDLTFREGQGPIVHLEADLYAVIEWASASGVRWAFSLSNAGARYTTFRCRVDELDQLDWQAIAARDFRSAEVKEGKQAEFLLHGGFPWKLIGRIGVRSAGVQAEVAAALREAADRPVVEIRPDWYY